MAWMKWTALANGVGKDIIAVRRKTVISDEVVPATGTDSRQLHVAFAALLEDLFMFYITHLFSLASGGQTVRVW